MIESPLVCYALTSTPNFYWNQLKISLESIRRHNPKLEIRVYSFGETAAKYRRMVSEFDATLVVNNPLKKGTYPYLVKWMALSTIDRPRVLFLDADTYVFKNLNRFFRKYEKRDFYARPEIATGSRRMYLDGKRISNPIDFQRLQEVKQQLGFSPAPLFNVGVMMFNHFSHRDKMNLELLMKKLEMIRSGELSYPCKNTHIKGEVALSLAMPEFKNFKWGPMSRQDVPFYLESLPKQTRGSLIHVLSFQYPKFLQELNMEGSEFFA